MPLIMMSALCSIQCFDTDGWVVRWHGGAVGKAFGLAVSRSWVQILL